MYTVKRKYLSRDGFQDYSLLEFVSNVNNLMLYKLLRVRMEVVTLQNWGPGQVPSPAFWGRSGLPCQCR